MKVKTFVVRVEYAPGAERVEIVTESRTFGLRRIDTTQAKLGEGWGDKEVAKAAAAGLRAMFKDSPEFEFAIVGRDKVFPPPADVKA